MRTIRPLLWILLILLLVLAVVLWTLPAQMGWRMLGSRVGPLHLSGISGTVWRGHADQAELLDEPIGAVDWRIDRSAMLHGRVSAQLTLQAPDWHGYGQLVRANNGAIVLNDAHFQVPASILQPVLQMRSLGLTGHIEVQIRHAQLEGVWVRDLEGQARWLDAGVTGDVQASLGELQARFASVDDVHVRGTLNDSGQGPLQLDGRFSISPLKYRVDARLRARAGDPQTEQVLQYLGQRQPDGSVHLHVEGATGVIQ